MRAQAAKIKKKAAGKPRGFASPAQRARREAEKAARLAGEGSTTPGLGDSAAGVTPPAPAGPAVSVMETVVPPEPSVPLVQDDGGSDEARVIAQMAIWLAEPWTYVRDVFGAIPDFWQDEALHALVEAKDPQGQQYYQFCLKACKGPGKTCLEAWIIWWFMQCHAYACGYATSVTGENLSDNLWKELAIWRNKSPMLQGLFGYQSDSIYAYAAPDTWFFSARTWPKDADKSSQAQTLAGLHGPFTLLVLDEGGGIPVGVLIAGLAHHSTQDPNAEIPEVHITLLCGNPDTLDGALGWACTEDAVHWWIKEITGDPDDPRRAPRIDINWAREMIRIFGRDNPWVLVNVFGKFPPSGYDKLLGPDQCSTAMRVRHMSQVWKDKPRIMTLDVARSTARDRSVLTRRQGPIIFKQIVYRLDDSNELAGQVAFEFGRWPGVQMIIVDIVGVGGPVFDHLKAIGLPVMPFNGGLPARDPRFVDRRTETWWLMASSIKGQDEAMLALPNSPELKTELCAPKVQFRSNGKMKLESKEDMLKRGINSPDLADGLAMTFAEPTLLLAPTTIAPSVVEGTRRSGVAVDYDPFAEKPVGVSMED